jgi:cytochrome c-type biogenesis protein CcmH/NrfF
LWFGPFVLLAVAAVFLGVYLRQRRAQTKAQAKHLSDEERERVSALLKG